VHAHRLKNALSDNAAVDRKEQQLHDDASVPFEVIGQSWCFSCTDRNRLEDAIKARKPAQTAGLVIPGRPFFPGNKADEARRHATLLEWLLVELLRPLADALEASETAVWLRLDSTLSADIAKAAVSRAWAELNLVHAERVQLLESMSLYAIDGWLDMSSRYPRHLAIAVQLRGAISGAWQTGQAEAGAAVLLSSTLTGSQDPAAIVCAHRPAKRSIESVDEGIADALRWGHCAEGAIETLWNSGLAAPLAKAFKSLDGSLNDAPTIELPRTIGDAGVATPWLALALAAAMTKESAGAQLILDQQDGDLAAMICRKNV
jgi:hypothetical protein